MTTKTVYIQKLPLPDSPSGTRWFVPEDYENFYPKGDTDPYGFDEDYLKSHPDFWEKEEPKRWKPKEEEEYFYIDTLGKVDKIHYWHNSSDSVYQSQSFNCFETKSEAERVAKLTRELWRKEGEGK